MTKIKEVETLMERGILVGVNLQKDDHFDYSMEELSKFSRGIKCRSSWDGNAKFRTCHILLIMLVQGKLKKLKRFLKKQMRI